MIERPRSAGKWHRAMHYVASCGCVLLLAGCGGAEFGQDARVPAGERYILAAGSPAGASLNLPADRPFNIHVKQSSQDQGPTGTATSRSDATPDGKAFARAETADGGSAKAEFKIGHRIDNTTAATHMMSLDISFNLRQEIAASDVPAPATLAKAYLVLAVIDSHKRAVSNTVVVQGTSDDARGEAAFPQQRHLTVRLEPGESYDVVLFGLVESAAGEDQRAAARIEVEGLQMALAFTPTPGASESAPAAAR